MISLVLNARFKECKIKIFVFFEQIIYKENAMFDEKLSNYNFKILL